MSFDVLDVDTFLQTLSCMNAQSLARIACTNKLGALAAHEAQQRPAILVLKGTVEEIAQGLREKLGARPTVAFVQYNVSEDGVGDRVLEFVRSRLPQETQVLGAGTDSLLCALHPDEKPGSKTELVVDNDEDPLQIGILVATLPEANAHVFDIGSECARDWARSLQTRLDDSSEESYSEEDMEEELQEDGPDEQLAEVEVDQTVDSHAPSTEPAAKASTTQLATSPAGYPAKQTEAADHSQGLQPAAEPAPDQMKQLLSLDPAPSVVVIHDAGGGRSLVQAVQSAYPDAAIIGGTPMGREILVKDRKRSNVGVGAGILAINGNAPIFALTSPMRGSPKTATEDVKAKMKLAEDLAAKEERRVLGALLFTCCARTSQTFGREGHDVILFQEQFPTAPLLGYYAGGEIGPKGKLGVNDLQSFERGNAQPQGYTAVYGFFLVPSKFAPSLLFQRAVLCGEVQEAFRKLYPA